MVFPEPVAPEKALGNVNKLSSKVFFSSPMKLSSIDKLNHALRYPNPVP